jgi:hypothetical protein
MEQIRRLIAASLLLFSSGAGSMSQDKDTGVVTLTQEEATALLNTLSGQTEYIKALEKRLTTCFNNT